MSLALALALGLQVAPGAVRVEVKGAVEDVEGVSRLRGAVVRRLLEGGYKLVGGDVDAAATVTLRRLDASVLVVVRAGSLERVEELPIAREDLLRLEVSHRVMSLLDDAPGIAAPRAPVAAVGFRGRVPTDADVQHATEPLVEAGFVVVAEDAPADWGVCVTWTDSHYVVERGEAPPCGGGTAPPTGGASLMSVAAIEAQRLLADHEAHELARLEALVEDIPEPEPGPEPEPAEDQTTMELAAPWPEAADEPQPRTPQGWGAVAVVGGLQGRASEIEGLVGVRAGGGRGLWGGGLHIDFAPSRFDELVVLDTFVSAGPTVRKYVSRRVALSAGILGGVLIHRFRYEGRKPHERVDANVVLPMAASIHVVRDIGLVFGIHLGASSRGRTHYRYGAIWSRSPLRWGVTGGIEFAFGPGEESRR